MADALPNDRPLPDIHPTVRNFLGGYLEGSSGGSNSDNVVAFPPQRTANARDAVRQAVADEWLNAGYSPAAVQGILRRVNVESGFDPFNIGDNGTSLSIYQHHADRATKLAQFLQQNGANTSDPVGMARLATKFAISEMNGGDPIAAKHRDELMKATDPNQAYGIFTASFERPAGSPGSEETNLKSTAVGGFRGAARGLLAQWVGDIQRRGEAYDRAIAESKDLHSASRAALLRWEDESNRPPQNMREAWNSWAGIATALATFGGLFGRRSMTASLNAAGEMLQAANAADARSYDKAYQNWKDHLDRGLKLIDLLNRDARDIVDDASKSYDRKVSELQTLSSAYQLERALDPDSVENLTKNLQLARQRQELIQAQNQESEVRNYKAEKIEEYRSQNNGAEPPASKLLEWEGQARRLASGTVTRAQKPQEINVTGEGGQVIEKGAAYQSGDGQWFWVGTNDPVTPPPGGKVNIISTAAARSGPAAFIQVYREEHPHASSSDIAQASAEFGRLAALDRDFASGPEGRNLIALNTVADHIPLFRQYAAAVNNGDLQRANQLVNAIARETGHPEITNFELARDFLADEVARVLVPGGAGALKDREDMKDRLKASMSPAQLAGGADTSTAFIRGKLEGLRQQYARGDTGREDYFNSKMLTPGARELFDRPGGAPAGAGGLPEGIPSGSRQIGTYQGKPVYQAPDGRRLVVQ